MNQIEIYTDGGCYPNPGGPGGWGAIIKSDDIRFELSGNDKSTTNNRMELTAAIRALNFVAQSNISPTVIHLYSDSQYLVRGASSWIYFWVEGGWRRGKGMVPNYDLWSSLLDEVRRSKHTIRFHWIRGHDGHPENTRCDELATTERKRLS